MKKFCNKNIFAIAKRFATVAAILASVLLVSLSCTKSPVVSDNGSGTGLGNARVIGKVIYADSTPLKNAVVHLRTQTYLADTSSAHSPERSGTLATVSTDAFGNFAIDSVDTGCSYSLEVNDSKQKAMATLYKFTLTKDSMVLATRIAKPAINVFGKVTVTGLPANAYVQVYGMEKLSRTDSSGSFEIKDLPEGECEHNECEYKLRILSPIAGGGVKTLDYELELTTGSDTTIARIELDH